MEMHKSQCGEAPADMLGVLHRAGVQHRTKSACPDLTKTLSLEVTIQPSNKHLLVVMV